MIAKLQLQSNYLERGVLFSFDTVERNEFFNLDGTCANWASELFDVMKLVSQIPMKEIYAGKYSRKGSSLRIHSHENATAPCKIPKNIDLKEMWQIRISASKGGIHGVFYENIFFVGWFDPQHNLYPNKNHGGLKRIVPPLTCCKDRDIELQILEGKCKNANAKAEFWEKYAEELEEKLMKTNGATK